MVKRLLSNSRLEMKLYVHNLKLASNSRTRDKAPLIGNRRKTIRVEEASLNKG